MLILMRMTMRNIGRRAGEPAWENWSPWECVAPESLTQAEAESLIRQWERDDKQSVGLIRQEYKIVHDGWKPERIPEPDE